MKVGLLHPGAMGAFLGSAVAAAGQEVLWAGYGRSQATHDRAASFTDVGTIVELVHRCEVIISVCPPEFALDVAGSVAEAGFGGAYLDLNAVSPQTVRQIAELLPSVVDGAVIGGPSTADAVLHLTGPGADAAAELFDPATVTTNVLDMPCGAASALKACYAASTKAVSALLLSTRAAAAASGVEDALLAEWDRSQPGRRGETDRSLGSVGAKAWRFSGEMAEAAAFFASVGAPDGFSRAAAEAYARLADLRDQPYEPSDVKYRLAR